MKTENLGYEIQSQQCDWYYVILWVVATYCQSWCKYSMMIDTGVGKSFFLQIIFKFLTSNPFSTVQVILDLLDQE